MKTRVELKISTELLKKNKINDEHLFRILAVKMVKEMPIDELHKLMNLSKINPNSEYSRRILRDKDCPELNKRRIHQLRNEDVILYEAECDLP